MVVARLRYRHRDSEGVTRNLLKIIYILLVPRLDYSESNLIGDVRVNASRELPHRVCLPFGGPSTAVVTVRTIRVVQVSEIVSRFRGKQAKRSRAVVTVSVVVEVVEVVTALS